VFKFWRKKKVVSKQPQEEVKHEEKTEVKVEKDRIQFVKGRKVYLTNPEEAKDIPVWNYVSVFRNTGHSEWEFYMGNTIISASKAAIEEGKTEADITHLFEEDLIYGDMIFTGEKIFNHIIRFFTIAKEEENAIYIRI